MKIGNRERLAILAMANIAKDAGTATVLKISQSLCISFTHCEKIMSQLRRAGLTKARRGRIGGHVIGKDLNAINLLQICRAVQSEESNNNRAWQVVNAEIDDFLASKNLQMIVDKINKEE